MNNMNTQSTGATPATTSLFNKIVAVITALSLVFLQVPFSGWASKAMADATDAAQEQLASNAAIDVPLTFENAYITYAGQIIAPPATMVTIPGGAAMEFTAEADGGYQLESVVATINGTEVALSPDGNGAYKLTAADVATTSNITVRGITAPTVEEATVTVEEPASSAGAATSEVETTAETESASESSAAAASASAASPAASANTRTEYTYVDNDVTVVAVLSQADAVPADAVFQVKPVTASSKGYNYEAYMQALNDSAAEGVEYTSGNTLLYDIAFMVPKTDEAGKAIAGSYVEFEPKAGTVTITITFNNGQLSNGIDATEASDVEIMHLPLRDSVREANESTENATNIDASDVKVESVQQPSASIEGETVSFKVNSLSVTGVSTANQSANQGANLTSGTMALSASSVSSKLPPSYDLADYLTNVNINAPQNANGAYEVTPGSSYSMTFSFSESRNRQFPDDNGVMSYTLPAGLSAADGQTGELSIIVNDGGTYTEVKGNRYWIENGVLKFQFNTSDPNFDLVTAAANTKINIRFSGSFAEDAEKITFKDGITKNLDVDTSNSVNAGKSAVFNKANGTVDYTVSVSSRGLSKNVVVKDMISGDALSLDASSIKAWSSTGSAVNMNGGASGNSFTYTIPQMKNGEVITFTYSAKIDLAKLKVVNGQIVSSGNNKVTVKSEGDPDGSSASQSTTIDYTPAINKSNGTADGTDGTKKTLAWTITANSDAKVSMAGGTITDTIDSGSQQYMKYSGAGITVKVLDANNNTIRTDDVAWNSLTSHSDSSWTYTVPTSDAGKAYKYVITYKTEAETSTFTNATDLKNKVTTDSGKTSWGNWHYAGNNGGNNGGSTQQGTDKVTIDKEVENIDREAGEISWAITFTVPAKGLTKAVLTDTFPLKGSYIENVLEDSIEVSGLVSGEGYDISYQNNFWQNGVANPSALIMTFKNGNAAGLKGTGSERTVTVRLKTEINDDWVKAVASNGWYLDHPNAASLDSNVGYVSDTANAQIAASTIKKTYGNQANRSDNSGLPVYVYNVIITNVTSDVVEIEDTFDTDLFELYVDPYNPMDVYGGTDVYYPSTKKGAAPAYVETGTGVKFVLNADSLPKMEDGSYFPAYRFSYRITPKDQAAMDRLIARAAESEGGKYVVKNVATWGDATDDAEFTYQYQGLKKEILTPDSELKKTDQDIWATFRITLNPGGQMLNGGQPLTMTDTFTNLSLDYSSIEATPSEGVSWDVSGNTATYTLPDQTPVVITYKARVVYTTIGQEGETVNVAFSNVAEMNGYRGEVNKTAERKNSGNGAASIPVIKLLKYRAGDMTQTLEGATFALLDANKQPILDKNGNAVKFTTDESGLITVRGDEAELGWSLDANTQYYLHEETAPAGYMLADFDYSFQITEDGTTDYEHYIYHTGDTMSAKNYPGTDVKVNKEWSDGNENHPDDTVTVKLQQKIGDGEWSDAIRQEAKVDGRWTWVDTPGKTIVLSASNDWAGIFAGLPLAVPEALNDNTADDIAADYRVVEMLVNDAAPAAGSGVVTQGADGGAYTFTISNEGDETTSVKVTKDWNDANNAFGLRPASVAVQLLADGEAQGSPVTLNAGNGWTHTWSDLAAKSGNADIVYTVQESSAPALYSAQVSTPAKNADGVWECTVTNSYAPTYTSVGVEKVWNDSDNRDGSRPESVTVKLLNNGADTGKTVTLSASNNWQDQWTDLPDYVNGARANYSVVEVAPVGYTVAISGTAADGYVVTNTHETEKTAVSVEKAWDDNNNQDGTRPGSVTVNLLANGKQVDSTVLDSSSGWKHTFQNLNKNEGGAPITYSVEEAPVPDGYTVGITSADAQIDGVAGKSFTVTNTHTLDTTGVKVTKVWDDSDNRDGARPDGIQVQLKANGVDSGAPVTLNADNNWTYTWSGLAMNADGKAVTYTVDEVSVPEGYTKTISGDMHTGFVITNSRPNDETSVSVAKVWDDASNQDGIQPKSVMVQLKADGTPVGAAVELNAGNGWSYTWTKLAKNRTGAVNTAIQYTVEETAVPNGYAATVAGDIAAGFTITNTHAPETTQITGEKVWNDNNNQDGKRATSVLLQLNANGNPVGSPVVVTEADGWKHTWTDLAVKANGNDIAYTVTETGTDPDYSVTPGNAANDYKVTNSYTPGKTTVSVSKVWEDQNDFDGLQPESITVQLKADGEALGDAVTLNAENGWSYTWGDLDKMAAGKAVSYTVEESGVPTGYATEVTGGKDATTGAFAYTITNTHTPELTSASVEKKWEDADNQDGLRAPVTVKLVRSDGVVDEQVLSNDNGWKHQWSSLPTIVNGNAVTYAVEEVTQLNGYTSETDNTGNDYVITNTHTPEKTTAKVTKTWNDNNNQDGKRSATVQLMANTGEDGAWVAVGDAVTVGTSNTWEYTWTDLDAYKNGARITYKVEEASVADGYTFDIRRVSDTAFEYAIENSYTPEETSVAVSKVWADDNDHDGLQPASIEVQLYANNEPTGDPVTLNKDNGWTHTWTGLDKRDAGKLITYTVSEKTVPTGYTMKVDGGRTGEDGSFAYTITNTHVPTCTTASVLKDWQDNNDQDGLRSDIVVQLKANDDAYGDPVTLSASEGWSYEWKNLPTIIGGKDVTYTIDEVSAPAGYVTTMTHEGNAYTITNIHTPETTRVPVEKVWVDGDNRDNLRTPVTVYLLANGSRVDGQSAELNASNNWKHTFANLPAKANGQTIAYTVEEVAVTGYTTAITGNAKDGFTITNTHTPDVTEVSVLKDWQDNDDQDGKRPSGVTVQLFANGTPVANSQQTLDAAHNWSYTWTNLPKNENGVAIAYTVDEATVAEGYIKGEISGGQNAQDGTFSYTIPNAHTPETTAITGHKSWNDANNQDNKRTETVQLQLNADGEPVGEPVTVGEAQDWSYTWSDLNVYSGGKAIVYTVTEAVVPADYSAEPGTADNNYTVTNSYAPGKTSVSVVKSWADGNNQDGKRNAIQVQLYADGEALGDAVTLSDELGWSHTWDNLPINKEGAVGQAIAYTVDEVSVPEGYEKSIAGNAKDGFTITNTHTPETTSMAVAKIWNDNNNQDGARPASVAVTLYANGVEKATVQLNDDNSWHYTWSNLPVYQNGTKIAYTVNEFAAGKEGYTSEVTSLTSLGRMVENTHTPETIDIPVTKVWNDSNDQDGLRKDINSVQVQLYADGEALGSPVALNSTNEWKHTFEDLPVYKAGAVGQAIRYTVDEVEVPAGYTKAVTGTAKDGFTITNSHTPAVVPATVTKVWNDNDDQDGLRANIDSITVQLLANNVAVRDIELTAANNWKATVEGLPAKANGSDIVYTLAEPNLPDGYDFAFSVDATTGVLTATNTHKPATVDIPVSKTWSDANDQDGMRPSSVTVKLLANGSDTGKTVVLNEGNSWTNAFEDLPKFDKGTQIVYSVEEVEVAGYTVAMSGNAETGFAFTNIHTPETTAISAVKAWDDADDQDGVRPAGIQVQLTANGDVVRTETLNAANGWAVTWNNLPVYANGEAIVYNVVEASVEAAGYTQQPTTDAVVEGVRMFTLTNKHVPEVVNVPVTKIWDDDSDRDSLQPASIQVQLYADGSATGDPVTLNAGNTWSHTWENLPAKANGAAIAYTVDEVSTPVGYEKSIAGNAVNGFTITNAHTPQVTQKTVRKVWNDSDNQDGIRPDSISVQLYDNGGAHGEAVELNKDNSWTYTWTDLPANYAKGVPAVYSVGEVGVDNYTTVASDEVDDTFTVTNNYTPGTTNVSVAKAWDDGDNRDGLRPDGVYVQLLANGQAQGVPVELNAGNQWHYAWTGLAEKANGVTIDYTIEEVTVEGYTSAIAKKEGAFEYTITNSYTPETVDIPAKKAWNDADDQDGLRADIDSVQLQLYADGVATGDPVTVTKAGGWAYTWTGLAKNRAKDTPVVYTVKEVGTLAGYTADDGTAANGYTVTNTHIPATVNIPVSKTWSDANDQDGLQKPVEVTLYADGVAKQAVTLNVGNQWKHTFTDLPKFAAGKEVAYTLEETSVPEGYTAAVSGNAATGFTVTNTHAPLKTSVSVSKTWSDANDQDGMRSDDVQVQLYADGVAYGDAVLLNDDNGWAYTWTDLDKRANKNDIEYTVSEVTAPNGYTPTVTGGKNDDGTFAYAVDNAHAPEQTTITGTKAWNDNNDQDGLQASIESVQLQLYANGTASGAPVTVTAADGWAHTWTGLDKYAGGEPVEYTVQEVNAPEGYTASVGNADNGYTVTNTHVPAVTSISATKVWDDADNQDNKRAGSVEVQLMSNNGAVGNPVTLSAGNAWTYTWENLPVKAAGETIEYSVVETSVPDEYTAEVTGDAETGFTVTNSYMPGVRSVSVVKAWDDADDQDGLRPDDITVQLKADGVASGEPVVLNAANKWSYTWDNLPINKAGEVGQVITYTIDEISTIEGYTSVTTGDMATGFTITNAHVPATTSIPAKKAWADGDDQDSLRPTGVLLTLYADGQAVATHSMIASEDWSYEFTGLPKLRDGGTAIEYTVGETVVPEGYTASVDGYTVTNTHVPVEATANFLATKTLNGRTLHDGEFSFKLYELRTGEEPELINEVVNNGTGQARFPGVTYTKPDIGMHNYLIEEVAGNLKGVTYDTTTYTFSTNVYLNDQGELAIDYIGYDPEKGVAFTNEYAPSGSVALEVDKLLDGVAPAAEAYTFQLADLGGHVYATAKNDANGHVTFPALDFTAVGTYKYEISEVIPEEAKTLGTKIVANDVAYDTHKVGATIVAVDLFNGDLDFTVTYDDNDATFVNTSVPNATFPLTATKHIDGRSFKAGDSFTFTVDVPEGAPAPERTEATVTPASGTDAVAQFGDIAFTTDDLGKSYTYTIHEVDAGTTVDGLHYDQSSHFVTLKVNGNADGTMRVDATYQDGADGVVFTNTYTASGEATLTATKLLEGRALNDGEFFFELMGDKLPAGVQSLRASADADGSIAFAPITFTQADLVDADGNQVVSKDFAYTITEVEGTLGGVTYDKASFNATVHVADNGDGTLDVTYTYDKTPEFHNTYHAESTAASLTAQKMLVGGTLQGGEFEFTLTGASENAAATTLTAKNDAAGKVAFDEITYDAAGVYEYRIAEVVPANATDNGDGTFTGTDGIVYDGTAHTATVAVTDNNNGKLVAEVAYDNGESAGISFGNTALARKGFEFNKYYFGGVGTFDFTLTAVDASGTPRSGTATDYSDAVTFVDDGTSAFTVTVQNGAYDGNVAKVVFPEISYAADGDYYYLVKEAESSSADMIADEAQYLVHVTVANGAIADTTYNLLYNGENYGATTDLSFYNNSAVTLGFDSLSVQSYTDAAQRVSVYPKAKKFLNDSTDQLVGGDFTFELIDGATGQTIAVATNDETGNIAFFDENTDPGLAYGEPGEWHYYIREVAGDEAGMTYDDSVITLTVTVEQTDKGLSATTTYNGPNGGEPAFYNVKEGMDIAVYKVSRFGGEGLDNCTYALWMAGEAGDVLMQEATSDETGLIVFRNVTLIPGQKYFFKEVEAPKGHTVDPYRTAYFSLNATGDGLVLVEETASDGWHSANENIELDKAKGEAN